MDDLLAVLNEMGIPLRMTTLPKGKARNRRLSAICFRRAITSPLTAAFTSKSAV